MAQGKTDYTIKVAAQAFYLDEQSDPAHDRYVFAYTVVIQNHGNIPAKLLSRHWIITDSNGKIEEVRGEGVVGEQPTLKPGEVFEYTSGVPLQTPSGFMTGRYQMVNEQGERFEIDIPAFSLDSPAVRRTLN